MSVNVNELRASVIVASTRASRGEYEDRTGPVIVAWLEESGYGHVERVVVADGPEVGAAIGSALGVGVDLIITTGGTGISPSDATPENTRPFIERELSGITEAIRAKGAVNTPLAALSRGIAGMSGKSLIVNFPGSRGGVKDGIAVLSELLEHVWEQREGGDHG